MHRPGPSSPIRSLSERGPSLRRFVLAYVLTLLFGVIIALAFLPALDRYERRSALDRQEAFSSYRIASQEQVR